MESKLETPSGDYDDKKEKALSKLAETLEECLSEFSGEENNRIRQDMANYMVGYLGVSYGLHVRR